MACFKVSQKGCAKRINKFLHTLIYFATFDIFIAFYISDCSQTKIVDKNSTYPWLKCLHTPFSAKAPCHPLISPCCGDTNCLSADYADSTKCHRQTDVQVSFRDTGIWNNHPPNFKIILYFSILHFESRGYWWLDYLIFKLPILLSLGFNWDVPLLVTNNGTAEDVRLPGYKIRKDDLKTLTYKFFWINYDWYTL